MLPSCPASKLAVKALVLNRYPYLIVPDAPVYKKLLAKIFHIPDLHPDRSILASIKRERHLMGSCTDFYIRAILVRQQRHLDIDIRIHDPYPISFKSSLDEVHRRITHKVR